MQLYGACRCTYECILAQRFITSRTLIYCQCSACQRCTNLRGLESEVKVEKHLRLFMSASLSVSGTAEHNCSGSEMKSQLPPSSSLQISSPHFPLAARAPSPLPPSSAVCPPSADAVATAPVWLMRASVLFSSSEQFWWLPLLQRKSFTCFFVSSLEK